MSIMNKVALLLFSFCCYSERVLGQNCTLSVASPSINFGNFNPFQINPITGINQTITIKCTGQPNPITFTLKLNAGGDNTYNPYRHMHRNGVGPQTLSYNLYMNAAHTVIWGDGTSSTSFVNQITGIRCRVNDPPCAYIAYGLLPAPQPSVTGGPYSAQITATLTYN